MKQEFKQLQGPKTIKWLGTAFIIFCVIASIFAIATVTSDKDTPIEYDVSSKTTDGDEPGGKKVIYWRVKSSEVPRWKKFANRWHVIKSAEVFWESAGGYTRGDRKSFILSHQNCEMKTEHTVEEFKQIKDSCHTVREIREYQKKQKELYRYNKRSAVEKRQRINEEKLTKDIWNDAMSESN